MLANRVIQSTKSPTLIRSLTNLGLTTNLQICLDAGASDSYTSGETWTDLSGNGNHFYRGADGTADGANPTFNGAVGAQSANEYWSFDGGDYFTLVPSVSTWMTNTYQNNSICSLCAWVYIPAAAYTANPSDHILPLFSVLQSSDALPTFFVSVEEDASRVDTGSIKLLINNDTSTTVSLQSYADGVYASGDTWVFVGISYDESGSNGNAKFRMNGLSATDSETPAGTTFSTDTTGIVARIGRGNTVYAKNTTRMAQIAVWDAYKTPDEMTSIYNATKSRYGL